MRPIFAATLCALLAGAAAAQAPSPPAALPFQAGPPLGVTANGSFTRMSSNVKVFGGVVSAESCSYDPTRNLIVVVNRGAPQNLIPNDGFISLLNHDGSVHTPRWIGLNRNGLVLNQPLGSDVHAGKLYVVDVDGGTADGAPRSALLRLFDLKTGAPAGAIKVAPSAGLNDIAVARDGTAYASQFGSADRKTPHRVYKISADGVVTVLVEGAPLAMPNGVAIDPDGTIVVANFDDAQVFTFSPQGKLLKTEQAAQPGSDGLVITPDGTKYLSSWRNGGISRIRRGKTAELIATGIPEAASMCYDPTTRQLVIPMNNNNAVAMVKLD